MGQVRVQQSIDEPLLYNGIKKTPPALTLFVISCVKWVLKLGIWVIFVAWVALIFLYPTNFMNKLFTKWIHATSSTPFGITGSVFLAFSGPVLIIALLSVVYHIISAFSDHDELFGTRKPKRPSFRLWTFPVLVDGPFQVVSATEFIGIVLFVVYVLWTLYYYTLKALGELPKKSTFELNCALILDFMGFRLGSIGLFCLAFLFLPISRGSVLLRLIEIPFEHATRYHVWLGHLTMLLFTLHGLFYVIAWTIRGTLLQEILEWKDIGIANLSGVISLTAGVLMWVTSLRPVRTNKFELFFYTHQLYVVFVIFFALHVGDFVFSIAAGGIFLFMLDRFLRFCQSRKNVDIVSAKCLPCGTLELVLSKPQSLRYNALSFIFIQIRELSWLQWHPFSVSSSPLDGKYHMTVLIKVLGKWTANLRAKILNNELETEPEKELPDSNKITASVEGPYGHDSPYYLMYENLVLVAGGIGLSPFLAILSDILHRVEVGKPCLPKNILVVWAVKKSNELSLLSTINVQSICPNFSNKLNLEICIYVTREAEPPLEEGKEGFQSLAMDRTASHCRLSKVSSSPMSVLVGTGDSIWSGLYVILSTLGFLVLLYLLHIYYINVSSIYKWWYKGLLFLGSMAASTVIFGGLVIGFWHVYEEWNSKNRVYEEEAEDTKFVKEKQNRTANQVLNGLSRATQLADSAVVQYGSRPDFKDILEFVSVRWGRVDVGVFVCGPPTLQSSVAREIRSHSLRRQGQHDPIFHFNSHSFDL